MQSLLSSHGGGLSAACVEGHAPRRPVCTTNTITPASSTLAPLSSMSLEERSPAARYRLQGPNGCENVQQSSTRLKRM